MTRQITARIVFLNEVYALSQKLALKIQDTGIRFDAIVAIARGGFPVARLMCDFLNIHHLGSMQITHYLAGATEQEKTNIIAPLNIDVRGKKILLVDDVNDTGKTLLAAHKAINAQNPALLKTAVIHEKKNTVIQVDFVGEYLHEWKWLSYQWAATEDILAFLQKDNLLNADESVAQAHLEKAYDLKIDKDYLHTLLQFRNNYPK